MNVLKALAIFVVTAVGTTVSGTTIGYVLGKLTSTFYRQLPISYPEGFDPVEWGLRLGLINGLAWGLIIGTTLMIVLSWRQTRRPSSSDQGESPLFSSDRERRLWAWTLAVVVAIYSTLGLARTLAVALSDSGLGAGFFLLACLMVLATVLTQGLTTRPSGAEIAVALGVAATYLLVFVRMAVPTERSHLIEYGVVAVFIYEALTERARQGRRVPIPALLAVLATSLVGVFDECIQAVLPSRVFEWTDILFNVLAAVMATATSAVLGWARRWAQPSASP